MPTNKNINRYRRHNRVKSKVSGTAKRPRLLVYRSQQATYAYLKDDEANKIIASFSDLNLKKEKGTKVELAAKVGENIAKIALEKKIDSVVFDRAGYKYHGRVKALADGARKGGLKF